MLACNNTPQAPTVVQITKLLPAKDAQSFRALGRVMSGVVRQGMGIRVLGEGFSAEDEEDMWKGDLGDVWINEAR
jgi:116 kDa U5 small nuclear ribonucleoprotein component